MKVAVSIPDRVFADADALAKRLGTSRSELYSRALDAFIAANDDESITAAINRVLDEVGNDSEPWVRGQARRILKRAEW